MDWPLKENIRLFLAWKATRSSLLWIPVFTLFYLAMGMSYTQILLVPVIVGLAQLLFEMPSGILADLAGRRYALFFGGAFWTASFYVLLIARGINAIFVSAALFGVALAFLSGSESAILYDTLKALKREKEYKRIAGKAFSYQLVGMALGSLLGAPITAAYGFSTTLIIVFGISSLTTFLPIFMREPPRSQESKRNFFTHLKSGVRFAAHHPTVRSLTLYVGLFTTLLVMSFRLFQPVLLESRIPVHLFGLVYAVLIMLSAMAAWNAERMERVLGERASLLLIPGALLLNFLPLAHYRGWGVPILLMLSETMWGFLKPVTEEYLNRHISSSHRATVLSLSGFSAGIFTFLIAPPLGLLIDAYRLNMGFFGLAGLALLGTLFIPHAALTARRAR